MSVEEREDLVSAEEVLEQEEEVVEENLEEEPAEPEEEGSEEVERAKKYGHLSKEEWEAAGRDPALWKSPAEFNKTGEIIEQLITLKKKVDQRDREMENIIKFHEKELKRQYDVAKRDLESRLAASKDDMDVEAVSHYTKELTRLQDMEQQNQAQSAYQAQQTARESFVERNAHWFNERNPDLQQRAVEIDNEMKQKYPNASYEDLADMIEAKIIKEYPERVLGQMRYNRPNTSPSQSAVNKTATVKKTTFHKLSQEHKDTYNVYKRINPKITEAEFIQRLKDDGEL